MKVILNRCDLPLVSMNVNIRAKVLQPLRLNDDIEFRATSQSTSYRPHALESMKPKYDDSLQKPPFMSMNVNFRAKELQLMPLNDDIEFRATSQSASYRPHAPEKYKDGPSALSMRPKYDDSLQKELSNIFRVRTGDSSYTVQHGLLAKVVLEENPYGNPRKEPRYGRWRTPYTYTYWV